MDDAARSLLDLWNGVVGTVAALAPADLARSTPDPAMDVGALGAHLAGLPGPGSLAARVTAARDDATRRLAGRTAGDRVLAAHCLDLWVHAHDLAAALPAGPSPGRADPARHTPVAVEACRLVADLAPRLVGPGSAAPRLVVREATGPGRVVLDRALGASATDTLEIEARALLLLVTGRADPETLWTQGVARWSGAGAAAFVDHVRLPGALSRPADAVRR